MLAITVATLFGSFLSIGSASANASSHGGWHIAAHGSAPLNKRTGLPVGTQPTRTQVKRMVRANAGTLQQNSAAAYHLTYYGGPVVSNVQVQPVRWGSGTYIPQVAGTTTPNMQTFFQSITKVPYPGWLSEYNTIGTGVTGETGQRIGAGSVLPAKSISPATPANGTVIYDSQIRDELLAQIYVKNMLPKPAVDAHGLENTTYALYFPAGVNICQDQQLTQCSGHPPGNPTAPPVFCGYHSSFGVVNTSTHQKVADVRYIVLPDSGSALWQSGCTTNVANTAATGLEAVASHELAEVITDPEVGEAGSVGAPLGWYDGTGSSTDPGEIADICDVAQSEHTTGITGTDGHPYVLENLWSNRMGACGITTTPISATNIAATPSAGGTIKVTWSAPAITGGLPMQYDVYETPPGGTRALAGTTSSTTWTSAPLTPGSTYAFDVVARNSAGSADTDGPASATPDATAPTLTVTSSVPASFTLTGSTKISYSAVDADSPTGITYDVGYKAAAWNGSWGALTTVARGTTATSASLALRPGTEYCLVVRARDAAGNVSGWTTPRCTAAPLDDTSLTTATSGWTRVRVTAAYRGTLTKSSKVGAKLAVTGATANRLGLVVATCPTCGNVQIYLGSTLWKTVSTKSLTWHYKRLLLPGTFPPKRTTVVLRVASGQAVIDALGVFRPAPTF